MSWIITGEQKNNWTPADIDTALWLDAADGATVFSDAGTTQAVAGTSTVQQWNDKSGNGRHVSQSNSAERPNYANAQIGGKVALDWGASLNSKSLTRDSMSYFPARYYGVAHYKGPNPFTATSGFITHNNSGSGDLILTSNSGTNWAFIPLDGIFLNGSSSSSLVALPAIATPFIFSTNFPVSSTRTNIYIGNDRLIADRGWLGCIGEIIATPTALAQFERQKIEGYLAHKWGLTANLPSDHPYKTVIPVP
jgi:hypothetical protein